VAAGKVLIGLATRLDPLPTTFDHPKRIVRVDPIRVNSKFVRILSNFDESGLSEETSCSPIVRLFSLARLPLVVSKPRRGVPPCGALSSDEACYSTVRAPTEFTSQRLAGKCLKETAV
jgi:hypothetical protein